jgi:hypothetical protein
MRLSRNFAHGRALMARHFTDHIEEEKERDGAAGHEQEQATRENEQPVLRGLGAFGAVARQFQLEGAQERFGRFDWGFDLFEHGR